MKSLTHLLSATAVTLALAWAGQAMAQSHLSGPNGTAMSPKLHQMLVEQQRKAIALEPQAQPAQAVSGKPEEIAASPKFRQMLPPRGTSRVAPDTGTVASYRQTGADGIAASPKFRQQMNEQSLQFQIAPLK